VDAIADQGRLKATEQRGLEHGKQSPLDPAAQVSAAIGETSIENGRDRSKEIRPVSCGMDTSLKMGRAPWCGMATRRPKNG
jgi:hypothetical protein